MSSFNFNLMSIRCLEYLLQVYSIPRFPERDCMAFLALVAKVTGKLKKGGRSHIIIFRIIFLLAIIILRRLGIPNTDSAARSVLHDWNCGKIKFYCKPPVKKRIGRLSGLGLPNIIILPLDVCSSGGAFLYCGGLE